MANKKQIKTPNEGQTDCLRHVKRDYDLDDLNAAEMTLKRGGIILYPTDTVWGLGCDARQDEAVKHLFEIKKRADAKAMLCLIDSAARITRFVKEMPSMAWDLIELTTKPLTIIYPDARNLASSLIAEDGSIGIRVTSDPFCQKLCERLNAPIVSTSANIAGQPTPRFFSDIDEQIIGSADYVVKYRQDDNTPHKPSSIIKLEITNEVKIIRD